MNVWRICNTQDDEEISNIKKRKGLRLRFQSGVDGDVRRACIDCGNWLRSEFYFPIRVPIYFKSAPFIKANDGEHVSATFFEPYSKMDEPYIRIATGDYEQMVEEWGKDSALAAILGSVVHELTHYFQWINEVNLTDTGLEKQATHYRKKIIAEYAKTREHP